MSVFKDAPDDPSHRITADEAVKLCESFNRILRSGDSKGYIDELVAAQECAENLMVMGGYAQWASMPRHPFAAGLVALNRWKSSGAMQLSPNLHAILEWAYLIDSFREDWQGESDKFSADLRSDKALSIIFELIVGHQFRLAGLPVKYIYPQDGPSGSFDLLLGESDQVEVECKLVKGHESIIEEIASQVFPSMHRSQEHRVVVVKCRDQATRTDITNLVREVRTRLRYRAPQEFTTRDGRFEVEMLDGGSVAQPLSSTAASDLRQRLSEIEVSLFEAQPLSQFQRGAACGVVRGIGLIMERPPNPSLGIVRAAIDASSQLSGDRPGIVAVGLRSPIPRDQENLGPILADIRREILQGLSRKSRASGKATKVSGVLLCFGMEGDDRNVGPAIDGGLNRWGWSYGRRHTFGVPGAAMRLPDTFRSAGRAAGTPLNNRGESNP